MITLIIFALLGQVSMPPIRVYRPFPKLVCPPGYSIWWPEGKEFQNDRYAECVKFAPEVRNAKYAPVTRKEKAARVPASAHSRIEHAQENRTLSSERAAFKAAN